jgi:ADP-ribosylation factor-like protein 4
MSLVVELCFILSFSFLQVRSCTESRGGQTFLLWDVGGQEKTRPLWRSYTRCTDGIIFVVDSSDAERLEEAKLELLKIAKLTERFAVPILVLANKQDLPTAAEPAKLEKGLGLASELGRGVGWAIQPCCAVTGEGLEEGLASLQEMILKRRRSGGGLAGRAPSAAGKAFGGGGGNKAQRKVQRSHSHHF